MRPFPLPCFVTLVALTACVRASESDLGSIGLSLVGQGPSGAVYRLRDAQISVTGPASKEWNSEDAPDQTSMSADVPAGDYTALVHDGWRLERVDGMSAVPVSAQLISDNPLAFTVAAQLRTTVPIRFRVDGGDVDLAQGYDLVISVEEPQTPMLVVLSQAIGNRLSSLNVYRASAHGDVAPVRQVIGGSTELIMPESVTVAGDQFVVANINDFSFGHLSFYPRTAKGDVLPSRLIGFPGPVIRRPWGVTAVGSEIYALDERCDFGQGTFVEVYSATDTGNVGPGRTLNLPIENPCLQPAALAVAGGEVYVVTDTRVDVYPAAASGPVTPTRTLVDADDPPRCPSGIAVHDGEIFLADPCKRQIRVLPAAASGPVSPLRVIAGPTTGLRAMGVFWHGGELYVSNGFDGVTVYPATASGDVPPTRAIAGPHTDLAFAVALAVF